MNFKDLLEQKLDESALLRDAQDYIFHTEFYIPISPGMIKRVYGEMKKIKAFHILGLDSFSYLEKIQGKKKTISVSTQYHDSMKNDIRDKFRYGIYNTGGIVVELEGDLLMHSNIDINSDADKQGRRWVPISHFSSNNTIVRFFSGLKKSVRRTLSKEFLKELEVSDDQWMGFKNSIWINLPSNIKSKLVRKYFDMIELNIKKNKNILKPFFFAKDPKKFEKSAHNEALMQSIRIKKVFILKTTVTNENKDEIERIKKKYFTKIVSIGDLMSHLPIKGT